MLGTRPPHPIPHPPPPPLSFFPQTSIVTALHQALAEFAHIPPSNIWVESATGIIFDPMRKQRRRRRLGGGTNDDTNDGTNDGKCGDRCGMLVTFSWAENVFRMARLLGIVTAPRLADAEVLGENVNTTAFAAAANAQGFEEGEIVPFGAFNIILQRVDELVSRRVPLHDRV